MFNLFFLIGRLNCGSKFGLSDIIWVYYIEWLMLKVLGCCFFGKYRMFDKDCSFYVILLFW